MKFNLQNVQDDRYYEKQCLLLNMCDKVKMTINGVQYNTKMGQYDKIITIFPSIFTTSHSISSSLIYYQVL